MAAFAADLEIVDPDPRYGDSDEAESLAPQLLSNTSTLNSSSDTPTFATTDPSRPDYSVNAGPGSMWPAQKKQRLPNWNEFYKNGLPEEVIVIEDSPEPSQERNQPTGKPPARYSILRHTQPNTGKKRKFDDDLMPRLLNGYHDEPTDHAAEMTTKKRKFDGKYLKRLLPIPRTGSAHNGSESTASNLLSLSTRTSATDSDSAISIPSLRTHSGPSSQWPQPAINPLALQTTFQPIIQPRLLIKGFMALFGGPKTCL